MNYHAATLTKMWRGACRNMFFMQAPELQKGSSMTMCYSNVLTCNSMEFDMDVWYDLHLTKSRFPVLQRTYLNLEEYEAFHVRCKNVFKERGAVTKLHANPHKPRGINRTKKTGNYAHGGCIHGWDFWYNRVTKKPNFAMHSRVSYLPYMGGLDLALSYHIAKEIGKDLGFAPEECQFHWYSSSFQFAHMQSVAFVWNDNELRSAIKKRKTYPDDQYPTVRLMRNTILSFAQKKKEGFKPEQEKFAQLMRYRRRWEARVDNDTNHGRWVSIPVDTLNLNSLRATRVQFDDDDLVVERNPHE